MSQDLPEAGKKTEWPIGQMRNPVIWKKQLNDTRSIAVESAYVYPIPHNRGSSGSYLQFAFVLADKEGSHSRQLLWIRTGQLSSPNRPYPSPGIDMLDATMMPNGELLVLFNQYGLCWAFRISTDLSVSSPNWKAIPEERRIEVNYEDTPWKPGRDLVSIDVAMKSGSISVDQNGKLQATCSNAQGEDVVYRLEQDHKAPFWLRYLNGSARQSTTRVEK